MQKTSAPISLLCTAVVQSCRTAASALNKSLEGTESQARQTSRLLSCCCRSPAEYLGFSGTQQKISELTELFRELFSDSTVTSENFCYRSLLKDTLCSLILQTLLEGSEKLIIL